MSNAMAKLFSLAAGVVVATLVACEVQAEGADISARRLIASWHDDDPGMRMVAEVIASAFASGFSWGGESAGRQSYCAPPDIKGHQIMGDFEAFVKDNPVLAEHPYGEAMAGTLKKEFPCGQGT